MSARPKTLQSVRNTMQTWEQGVAQLEMTYSKKVLMKMRRSWYKSIMRETLFGEAGVFRGISFKLYVDLRTSVIEYLDDKVPVSMKKQGPSLSTANMVHHRRSRTR